MRAMPPEFNPNRVRENVETAKQWVRQGQWTPAELQAVESRLGAMEAAERRLHDARLAMDAQVIGGGELGAGYRFLEGANRANYFSGGLRFQVNCQEAFVAFHNSLKFNREFVAGPPVLIGIRLGWRRRWGDGPAGGWCGRR
ncbi:hypothetical protein [Saccharopolyspora spinosa]|uniref:hypothetical protein n=1 Tax=Saccharopolyspora spinosa TaxID=60894 RepID=UPI00376EF865